MTRPSRIFFLCLCTSIVSETRAFAFIQRKSWKPRKKMVLSDGSSKQQVMEKELDRELLSISFFSFLHQAAMPFADLVDGSYLSTLDSNSLGAVGVVRSSQNSVSKLYNSPLSKTTISLIASASGEEAREEEEQEKLSAAVSSALTLALLLGTVQALVFILGARPILAGAGVQASSSMFSPAMAFMKARALSAPTSTLWLVATNVFRGLGDATTPLIYAVLFNAMNLVSDHILIDRFHVGITGAPIGTTIAQAIALVPLLIKLNDKVPFWLKFNKSSFRQYLARYGKAGVYLVGRSAARIAAVSYCSRRSAQFGSVAASSYSILYQIGLWVTIVSDGVSIATQSLLSRHIVNDSQQAASLSKFIILRAFQGGAALVTVLSILLYMFRSNVISVLTKSADIQAAALDAFPVFLLAQLAKGFAFPVNGIIMGGMDWGISMWSMCFANLACFISLRYVEHSPRGIWVAWMVYYLGQGLVGIVRYKSRTGIWKRLKSKQ